MIYVQLAQHLAKTIELWLLAVIGTCMVGASIVIYIGGAGISLAAVGIAVVGESAESDASCYTMLSSAWITVLDVGYQGVHVRFIIPIYRGRV